MYLTAGCGTPIYHYETETVKPQGVPPLSVHTLISQRKNRKKVKQTIRLIVKGFED